MDFCITVMICTMITSIQVDEPLMQRMTLVDFSQQEIPDFVQFNYSSPIDQTEQGVMVEFAASDWPNVFFHAPESGWDWSGYVGIGIDVRNLSDESVEVAMRLDNAGADGVNNCNSLRTTLFPQQRLEFCMWFKREGNSVFWGMRGLPGTIKFGDGKPLDLKAVTGFQFFLPHPRKTHVLQIERVYLFGTEDSVMCQVKLPFVDRFGQYKHAHWPGKLLCESEFATRRREEAQNEDQCSESDVFDSFRGWKSGPKRKASGWFRTEQVDGKWWLVTPTGSLFLSLGINCIGTWERTFVEKRESWFEWLPSQEDLLFGPIFHKVQGAHSMAEPVGGAGLTFSFYCANLIRKYGSDWESEWRTHTYSRLCSWGFTTIGNWSQEDVLQNSIIPFIVSAGVSNVPPIESAKGYWSKMMDVYDTAFPVEVDRTLKHITSVYSTNPLCIGYFVDNELAWEGVIEGVLTASPVQPARQALLKLLRERYETVEQLNAAWETGFHEWNAVSIQTPMNDRMRKDMDNYLYVFALRYFSIIRETLKRYAPNQLYLGCRFSTAPEAVVRACGDIADVISFNLYYNELPKEFYANNKLPDKPILVGEFHFGALDRGMFHTGLVATRDQNDRAIRYKNYVKSILEHPSFVGCHWFQYIDEPITGRWYDGENYNIGFVDVTDTPYPELVESAKEIHHQAYTLRYGSTSIPSAK